MKRRKTVSIRTTNKNKNKKVNLFKFRINRGLFELIEERIVDVRVASVAPDGHVGERESHWVSGGVEMDGGVTANISGAKHAKTRETYPVLGWIMAIGAWRVSLDAS